MLDAAFAPQIGLKDSSRLPSLSRSAGITTVELACLLICGALAALAVGLIHGSFGIPGVAILRGLLPIALGFAIVPRRSAGTAMSLVTCATASLMNAEMWASSKFRHWWERLLSAQCSIWHSPATLEAGTFTSGLQPQGLLLTYLRFRPSLLPPISVGIFPAAGGSRAFGRLPFCHSSSAEP